MNIKHNEWQRSFRKCFEKAVTLYEAGKTGAETFFDSSEATFLRSIGCTEQELYDFVEDFVKHGEPDFDTALLVAAVRRDYFLVVMNQEGSSRRVAPADLPPKDLAEEGIVWLPRIIEKAKAKLRGEMDPDLMYGCGGDRRFFSENNVHPADFLRHVWAAGENRQKVVDYVKHCRASV
ncbi:MAG: DUF5069 domain-containing protein [Candidatus Methylacidiphilales bacterium]